MGICGTDHEIIAGEYGEAPPGADRPGPRARVAGPGARGPEPAPLQPGDLVAGIVRHPDPVPCPNCAVGEWDMCRNGQYTEHGIKELAGFARDRWRVAAAVRGRARPGPGPGRRAAGADQRGGEGVGPHRADRRAGPSGSRRRVLVTGAGPIGLLAALLGTPARARRPRARPGHRRAEAGAGRRRSAPRTTPVPVNDLAFEPDVVIECTGAPTVVLDVMCKAAPDRDRLPDRGVQRRPDASTSTPGRSTGRWCWRTTWCSAR